MSQDFAYLSPEQRESLNTLPFSVLLPAELLPGWSLASIDFEEFEEGAASFALNLVADSKRLSFLTTNDGIGDAPPGARQSVHSHPELGEIHFEHEDDGDFLSVWLEVENGWSALGGQNASDTELDQVVASLVAV